VPRCREPPWQQLSNLVRLQRVVFTEALAFEAGRNVLLVEVMHGRNFNLSLLAQMFTDEGK
jgi:hypothetical protein